MEVLSGWQQYQRRQQGKFVLIGVAQDQDAFSVARALRAVGPGCAILIDRFNRMNDVFAVADVPQVNLIDEHGVARAVLSEPDEEAAALLHKQYDPPADKSADGLVPSADVLEAALARNPSDADAKLMLGYRLAELTKPADLARAAKLINEAITLRGDEARAYFWLGVVEARRGNKEAAIAAWGQAGKRSDMKIYKERIRTTVSPEPPPGAEPFPHQPY